MTPNAAGRRSRSAFQVMEVLAVAVCSALSWFAWIGWDQEYQVNRTTGVSSGPYEAWQVIGCALSLLLLFVCALLAGIRPLLAAAALTLAFTVAWTVQAAANDDTGMFGVGMLMLLVGLTVTTALVSVITLGLRDWWAAKRRR